eukprot:TRINITY_DN3168_c0_g2_i1.p2 TRINITY_DN3168_c0_g2~~TRINITY_DN3168_c0_g2_i1.p2  ORF type:complete len:169 (+),score=51.54 TRINITY_DN3168_c0_g2_i1:811-1317(+)
MSYCTSTTHVFFGLSVNHFGDTQGMVQKLSTSSIVTVLDNAATCWIASQSLLLSNRSGDIFILKFTCEGSAVDDMKLTKLREEGSALSAACMLSDNILFLGSRVGDSVLVRCSEKEIAVAGEGEIKEKGEREGEKEEEKEDSSSVMVWEARVDEKEVSLSGEEGIEEG